MNTKRLVYIAIFTALTAVGGLISVPIPFTQVEVSLQTPIVIAAGLFLGGIDGALAVLIYVVMGLLGLPVFTKGGGIGYVLMPSFGYLIGFPIGAFVTGMVFSHMKRTTRGRAFVAGLCGMVPIYLIGATYQVLIVYYYIGSTFAAAVGGLPAIVVLAIKDAVLCGFAAVLYPSVSRTAGLRRRRRERRIVHNKNNVTTI